MKDEVLVMKEKESKRIAKIIGKVLLTMDYKVPYNIGMYLNNDSDELVFLINDKQYCFMCGLRKLTDIVAENIELFPRRLIKKFIKTVAIPYLELSDRVCGTYVELKNAA